MWTAGHVDISMYHSCECLELVLYGLLYQYCSVWFGGFKMYVYGDV